MAPAPLLHIQTQDKPSSNPEAGQRAAQSEPLGIAILTLSQGTAGDN